MLAAKQVADLMTFSRALIAVSLALIGLIQGDRAVHIAACLLILSWTSDALDGGIARRSRQVGHTWVGDHDLEFDMLVAVGVFIYLAASGFIPTWLVVAYPLVWALLFWRFGVQSGPGKLFQAPIYAFMILIAIIETPLAGWAMVAWILAAVILTWPRFPQEVVPSFLGGMQEFINSIKARRQ